MKTNIFIMGNGFDLQCDLKTSYYDFYIYRYNKNIDVFNYLNNVLDEYEKSHLIRRSVSQSREYNKTLVDKVKSDLNGLANEISSELNSWDLIFSLLSYKNRNIFWFDLEKKLELFITTSDSVGKYSSQSLLNIIHRIDVDQEFSGHNINLLVVAIIINFIYKRDVYDLLFLESKKNFEQSAENYFQHNSLDNKIFNRFLLCELKRFEHNLKKYIFELDSVNKISYTINSSKLINKCINLSTENVFYINFNYTLPDHKNLSKNGKNVHGYIGESIDDENSVIIGFDQHDIKLFDPNILIFTKTHRIMMHKQSLISQNLPKKEEVSKITFYGHSLGKADDSYFFSLFDYYDLYSNDIVLDFKYSIYNRTIENEIIYALQISISRLLQTYGATMSNKDHGKNLQHKLILENRLKVTLI